MTITLVFESIDIKQGDATDSPLREEEMELAQYGKEIEEMDNPLMDEIFSKFSLMYEHYIEQNEIEYYFVASDSKGITGFMGVGYCGRTVLIEVLDRCKGQGVGTALIQFAVKKGCKQAWQPRQNGCEEFWTKIQLASENPDYDMREVA